MENPQWLAGQAGSGGGLRPVPSGGGRSAAASLRDAEPHPLRVRFNDPAEFAEELRARGPNVEPVVRVTYRWTADTGGLPLRHLSVVAGYLRRLPGGAILPTELVHYAGEVWHGLNEQASQLCRERANRARDEVARAAQELGLVVCPGIYTGGAGE
jgi:hypothetical protein